MCHVCNVWRGSSDKKMYNSCKIYLDRPAKDVPRSLYTPQRDQWSEFVLLWCFRWKKHDSAKYIQHKMRHNRMFILRGLENLNHEPWRVVQIFGPSKINFALFGNDLVFDLSHQYSIYPTFFIFNLFLMQSKSD